MLKVCPGEAEVNEADCTGGSGTGNGPFGERDPRRPAPALPLSHILPRFLARSERPCGGRNKATASEKRIPHYLVIRRDMRSKGQRSPDVQPEAAKGQRGPSCAVGNGVGEHSHPCMGDAWSLGRKLIACRLTLSMELLARRSPRDG